MEPKLALANAILHDHYAGRQMIVLLYGRGGMGKSSYAIQNMKELYEGNEWRNWMVWDGKQFADCIERLLVSGDRIPCLTVDDASKIFFYMNFHNQDTQDTLNWVGLARTRVTCTILTTQVPGLLLRQLRDWEGLLKGKIGFGVGGKDMRHVTLYQVNITPWDKKYKNPVIEDTFNVKLPMDDFLWYQPQRQHWLDAQSQSMIDNIRKRSPNLPPIAQIRDGGA